ncbi:SpaA isopeptide-forming pilin-related protein [Bacillus spizizenii]
MLKSGLTTDEKGQITVHGLKAGEYQFVETKAPKDYHLDQTPISFRSQILTRSQSKSPRKTYWHRVT